MSPANYYTILHETGTPLVSALLQQAHKQSSIPIMAPATPNHSAIDIFIRTNKHFTS